MSRLRSALAVASTVAALAVAVAAPAPAGAGVPRSQSGPAVGRLATPVLSVRRLPGLLTGQRAETSLRAALDRALAAPRVRPVTSTSCVVVRSGSRTLYQHAPDRPVIPASTLKLLTGTAALEILGPDTRLATTLRAAAPASGGTLTGDLQVLGGGDPLIATAAGAARPPRPLSRWTPIEAVADAVVAAGVRRITGGVRGDDSRFDRQRTRPGWKPSYLSGGQVGPIGALLVDDGRDAAGRPVSDPALHFAASLTAALRARGVEVAGSPASGPATGSATVAVVESLPVRDLVAQMLVDSDNTTAEVLMKEIGVRAGGAGTTDAGLAAARRALAARGVDVEVVAKADASGLDRSNRATCGAIAGALVLDGSGGTVSRSLPVAGRSGTLERRFVGTGAEGRVRAKTGTLDGVTGLAGWVDPKAGSAPPVAFAAIANGASGGAAATALPDAVALALATWPDAPDPARLAPEPVRR